MKDLRADEPGSASRLNVLVVDDKPFVRRMAVRLLERAGVHAVQEAENGAEALRLIDAARPAVDLVFCDLVMPDIDGLELVRHIATRSTKPAFVFVSGTSAALLNTTVEMARARGVQVLGAIEKPMTSVALQTLLNRFGDTAASSPRASVSSTLHRDDLAQALEENWILLHYQPKVSLKTGTVAGFEGLVRLLHPVRGIVGPDQFIGLAEECGLIGPLTDRVVDLGLQQLADWSRAGLKTKVSLNLSATVLADLELPDRMSARALSLGLEPAQVILEITETGAFRDSADTLEILARLHMKGFALSIDDFGTGYSSLDQLRRVPFSELKIDRAFVHGAAESAKARAILRSSAELGRSLGMSVVAEGAEDDADLSALVDDRVDMVQGYVFSRPLAAVDALPWSARWAQQGTHLTRR